MLLEEHPEWASLTAEELVKELPEHILILYSTRRKQLWAAEQILKQFSSLAASEITKPFTYDMKEVDGVAFSFRDKLLSILTTKKVVLAFEKGIGDANSSTILDVFDEIERLRKDPKYAKFIPAIHRVGGKLLIEEQKFLNVAMGKDDQEAA